MAVDMLTVRYLAELSEAAGCDSERVPAAEAATLRKLLEHLAGRHGEPLRGRLLDQAGNGLADGVFAVVNGRHVCLLDGLDTGLSRDDTVSFVPVIEFG